MSYERFSLLALALLPGLLLSQTPSISTDSTPLPAPVAAPHSAPQSVPTGAEATPVAEPPQGVAPSPTTSPRTNKTSASDETDSDDKNAAKKSGNDNDEPVNTADLHHPVLWHNPGNISALDLYYGQGGKQGQPMAPFAFESEDHSGTNPKFDARDANGKKWRVKLGTEARPEVVASRFLWAMGYYVNDDYLLPSADIDGLHLQRGGGKTKNGRITEARFARKPSGQKKIGIWKWKENPFTGTKEFNGLRVMMAVMNNWDLKDVNNAVFTDKNSRSELFLTSDIGATFGTNGLSWTIARSKGNIGTFKDSKFIEHADATEVDFGTPKPPTAMLLETGGLVAKQFAMRKGLDWIGRNVPREDARWMGSLLRQLSHQQLVDAFRAGDFPTDQIDAYVDIVESRIRELAQL